MDSGSLNQVPTDEPGGWDFLADGGVMGARIRAFDWAATLLGEPGRWPRPLCTLLGVMLQAGQPMFLAWGPDRLLFYNDAYVPLLGTKHPAALGQDFLSVWREVESDLTPLFQRVFSGQPVHMADIELLVERHGVPEEAHFAFSYTPVRDSTGQVAGLFCACMETTAAVFSERRRAFRLALADEVRRLSEPRAIMEATVEALGRHLRTSRVGYGEIEPDGETIVLETSYASGVKHLQRRVSLALFGEDIVRRQRTGLTVFHPDLAADPAANPENWVAIQAASLVSVPLIRDGRFRACLYVTDSVPRQWSEAEIALIEDVAARTWDAVERARAEAELRSLNDRLEQRVDVRTRELDRLWRNAQDLLTVVDMKGNIQAVSPSVTSILGWSEQEARGRHVIDFVHPDDRSIDLAPFQPGASGELPRVVNRLLHRDGSLRWIAWVAAPEGELIYASGRDVTAEREQALELRAMEETLRQSQKMEAVGQLTGGLAHDFNNLLTGISGSLELMQKRLTQGRPDKIAAYIDAAQGAARRAAALTHRLLAFARRQTLDAQPTDAGALVLGMAELIRSTVGPAIALDIRSPPALWTISVDRNQLEGALLNLCINARDAMPEGGTIVVECRNETLAGPASARDGELRPGDYVRLCVSDTGTGMTEEVARRAFDPFFTTKPIGMGTGLGLSMVYGFVRQSGGLVRIESRPGEGTTVCLHLPQVEGEAVEPDGPGAPAQAGEGSGEQILLVDDEPTIRMLLSEVLGAAGYALRVEEDGAGGLRVLQSGVRLDMMITDVGLPGSLNGRQLADAARALRPTLPILFITGFAENAVLREDSLEPGMQVLTKPFEMSALTRKVAAMLGHEVA